MREMPHRRETLLLSLIFHFVLPPRKMMAWWTRKREVLFFHIILHFHAFSSSECGDELFFHFLSFFFRKREKLIKILAHEVNKKLWRREIFCNSRSIRSEINRRVWGNRLNRFLSRAHLPLEFRVDFFLYLWLWNLCGEYTNLNIERCKRTTEEKYKGVLSGKRGIFSYRRRALYI